MIFADCPLESIVSCYYTQNGCVCEAKTPITSNAAIIGHWVYKYNSRVDSVLLGWKEGEKISNNCSYRGKIPHAGWIADTTHRYVLHESINDYTGGAIWLNGGGACAEIVQPNKIIPITHFPLPYIASTDVLPGDTIAWVTRDNRINYAIVSDISEGENAAGDPTVLLEGHIYCGKGLRSFPQGYPLNVGSELLLIKRGGK